MLKDRKRRYAGLTGGGSPFITSFGSPMIVGPSAKSTTRCLVGDIIRVHKRPSHLYGREVTVEQDKF